ncbi:MAG: pyruvate carboxylase [Planctomycetes bacterium]|nr:pyruvate carboxylase [Planctomycetota bacterium]
MEIQRFHKILCANRGEIAIRVFRACTELGRKTVAIFSEQDATHQHRYKADEAYLVGKGRKPVDAYLAIDEILDVAERAGVDAIHPGYGVLSENATFAAACRARGIAFIGPRADVIKTLGDKVAAKQVAERVGVPTVPGLTIDLDTPDALQQARVFCQAHAPVIVKAAHGGGGRGMRVVERVEQLEEAAERARSEAKAAFGSPQVFLEKFLVHVRHIEVQVLGDLAGEIVHLYERDCSVQRRHQKVIEVAPANGLPRPMRQALLDDALRIAREVGYHNAGTVEFLVGEDQYWFIEVNPRLQVEHTVTEVVTGIDLVQAQILVEEGHALSSEEIGIYTQAEVRPRGCAIQCRVTTEDPANGFLPDTGTITAYRSAEGLGIRLDSGSGYTGAHITPHYDSLLVKVTSFGQTLAQAAQKGLRALQEFRIRGVKTNLRFLENVLRHEAFLNGRTWTRFIDETPELFMLTRHRDRATRLLSYLAEVVVNGHPTIPRKPGERPMRPAIEFVEPPMPRIDPDRAPPSGVAQILEKEGPAGVVRWVKAHGKPLMTDTTMRDAHQSLLATRVRTRDIVRIAPATAHLAAGLFSVETWGGATFDVAYRFLHEDPWDRLRKLKRAMPNLLQQMLLRGANAVGYTSYPNNVVESFVDEAAAAGVDVFRVFDSLNDLANMRVAVNRVIATGKLAELAICYTGDVDNPARSKYGLHYYLDLAKRIEDMGAHILCIKDMAGLLRPHAAELLIGALRDATSLPIHLHTHDTSGNGIATLIKAIETGTHIVDVALAPMAGLTSQPSLNALIAALRGGPHDTGVKNKDLQSLADYWEAVREYYGPFECGLKSGTAEVYYHEIPGGQYSNLRPQVASLGLLERWNDVKHAFAVVNQLVGDIPKVTPSSKMVGDFATFVVQNDLLVMHDSLAASVEATRRRVLENASRLDFPVSVVQYFQGHLGHPPGGFPEDLRKAVLKGLPVLSGNPSDELPPLDLEKLGETLQKRFNRPFAAHEVVSHALYPRVMDEFFRFRDRFGDVSILDTPSYFYGLEIGREVWVELEEGKTLVIRLDAVSEAAEDGSRTVYFTLNGQARPMTVVDRSLAKADEGGRKADPANADHVGAPMPGKVIAVAVKSGDDVKEGDPLVTLEAMKMETIVRAPRTGKIAELVAAPGRPVQARDLLLVLA